MNDSIASLSNESVPNKGKPIMQRVAQLSKQLSYVSPKYTQAGWTEPWTHLLAAQHATTIYRLNFSEVP